VHRLPALPRCAYGFLAIVGFPGIYGVGGGNRNPLTCPPGRSVMAQSRGSNGTRGAGAFDAKGAPSRVLECQVMKSVVIRAALAFVLGIAATAASAQTLTTVKQRGVLNCGSNGTLAGFGLPDSQGRWAGLDVDFCKALAAAIFNDMSKVKFVPLTAKDRFTALQSGEVDVLARNTTWT
jgi:hypothetical protein